MVDFPSNVVLIREPPKPGKPVKSNEPNGKHTNPTLTKWELYDKVLRSIMHARIAQQAAIAQGYQSVVKPSNDPEVLMLLQ